MKMYVIVFVTLEGNFLPYKELFDSRVDAEEFAEELSDEYVISEVEINLPDGD